MTPNKGTKTESAVPQQSLKSSKFLASQRGDALPTGHQGASVRLTEDDVDLKSVDRRSSPSNEQEPDQALAANESDPAGLDTKSRGTKAEQYAQASTETVTAESTAAPGAAESAAASTSAEGAAASVGAQVGGMSFSTIGAGLGVLGLAAAAGGGGGSSSSGSSGTQNISPPNSSAPPAPTVDSVTGNDSISSTEIAAGVTVTGTGTAGAILSIVWGSTTKTATVDSAGRWSVAFASSEIPATQGTSTISASQTSAGLTSAVTPHAVTIDANLPGAPTIGVVSGDNLINASERAAGITVSGDGLAQSTVTISWGNTTKTAIVDNAGHWNALFAASEIPATQGTSTISATETRLGQTSASTTRSVTIDTVAPSAPTVQVSGTGIVSGTTSANNKLTLDFTADGVADVTVTAGANGSFTFPNSLNNSQTVSVIAFDAAGNPSPAGSPAVPIAPTISAVSTDDLINATERAAGITVAGTGLAGAEVTVTWGNSSKSATVDGAGNWTSKFSSGEIPGADGTSTISATETRLGQTSSAATHLVTVDTVAPTAPTISVSGQGLVSGKTDSGNKLTIDSNGDGIADATAIAATNGTFTFTTAFTSGQQLVVNSFDTAGNKSASASATAPSTNFGSSAPDVMTGSSGADLLIGGSGADQLNGGAGDDQLFGGSAASVRNYQFEYWDLRGGNAAGIWDNGLSSGNIAFLDTSNGVAGLGWSLVDYLGIAARQFGSGASAEIQWLGLPDNVATPLADEHIPPLYQLRETGATGINETPDTSGRGGRYMLAASIDPTQGGTEILQTVVTNPNESYSLNIHSSIPDQSNNSIVIRWKGAELAVYDAITNTWSGTAPTVTPDGASHVNMSWNVTGQAGAGASDLDIRIYSTRTTTPANQHSLRIDSVTLDSNVVDGDDLLVGGGGRDILYGQAGDDTLYGGAAGAVDNSGNAFVYSMRTANGNDVIKDFRVGNDRLSLIDLVDSHLGTGVWNAASNPDASRTPDSIRVGGQGVGTTNDSDNNLNFRDLLAADSPNQYLDISSDGTAANNVRITLHGYGGATIGSIVLEGVQYGTGAGQYDTVQDLMGSGYHDPNVLAPVGSPTQILFVTMEGYNPNLLV